MNDPSPQLRLSMFEPLLGQELRVRVDEDQTVLAKLTEATRLPDRPGRPKIDGVEKEAFSLIFELANGEHLPQRTYSVEHESIGSLDLFLVPVGFGELQAIIN